MPQPPRNEEREQRIVMEIVVDAYDKQERAIGWYYYLEGKLNFPFFARCAARRSTSPLKVGDEVEVIGMAPVEDCEHDMFVEMDWDEESLAVPLSQLEVIDADDETREAVEDWLYWTKKGSGRVSLRKASSRASEGSVGLSRTITQRDYRNWALGVRRGRSPSGRRKEDDNGSPTGVHAPQCVLVA